MPASIRVLLVEDSPTDALLLREALRRTNEVPFDVSEVSYLREALAAVKAGDGQLRQVDVVLLDLGLPDSDGLETFLTLRRQDAAVPVVVLTGTADETLGMRAVQAGAQDYLVKGQVEGATLARAIRYAIERRRSEETVRQYAGHLGMLSRRLLHAQEAERRRLARELHDELGQVLTAVKISVEGLRKHVQPPGLPRLEEGIEIINRAIQQVRDLSLDLRPSLLDDLGLAAALRWYADRQAQRGGFTVLTVTDGVPIRLPSELETACFRVVQEALTNVLRHAQARHVQIALNMVPGALHLTIQDDGIGFDSIAVEDQAGPGSHLGLLGMRERVHLAGGSLELVSQPNRGTTLRAWLPYPDSERPEISR